ncbi:ADP-ribosylation factor 6 isoform X1 [Coccinella septempunctata]|uniref:ADP-ribosylation factor 6 isoform X1 n=1 Tax=Coccinella septempunctata TaxID=41139 RepID=UPI001D071B62|nr:ADP-ribosylation factor 6 isoform X1 [Coccinella septempunctata]
MFSRYRSYNTYIKRANQPNRMSILCLGPKSSGKTHLLKKLQTESNVDNTSTSVPTIGTNMYTIKHNDYIMQVREVGGSMAPLWHKYFGGISIIIYVIDASNLCQISAAGVLFYSLLTDPALLRCKILLILSKSDASYRQMRNEALLMLQMKRLQKEIRQKVTIMVASAITGEGREEILNWMKKQSITHFH